MEVEFLKEKNTVLPFDYGGNSYVSISKGEKDVSTSGGYSSANFKLKS